MNDQKMFSVYPGEILLEDFMKPLGITQYRLAKEMNIYPRRVNEIVHGKRASPPTRPCGLPVSLAHPPKCG